MEHNTRPDINDRWKKTEHGLQFITWEQLKKIVPHASKNADVFVPHLNKTMERYEINTRPRIAMFIAQLAHESGSFRYTQEIASGAAYEGRKDLGNTEPGDGKRFKGRGLIQCTGRDNYRACSKALFGNDVLLTTPQLLETPQYACLSAGWYWEKRNLNIYADKGAIKTVTVRINGGLNGYDDRKEFYERALGVLAT